MDLWWKKNIPAVGVVLFPGDLPDRFENYKYLENMGITITPKSGDADNVWSMTLNHNDWGQAIVLCPRNFERPPDDVINYTPHLQDEDRENIRHANNGLLVCVTPKHGNILRDGKLALRYYNALMENDGIAVYTAQSAKFWTPVMLYDELCHNADLDVEALYNLHSVYDTNNDDDNNVYWIHSHGLKEMGFIDFSIIKPSKELVPDFYRSIAYLIVEGRAKIGSDITLTLEPHKQASLVSMADFLESGDKASVDLIKNEVDEYHSVNSAVLCDLKGNWFKKLFSKQINASHTLMKGLPDNSLVTFSTTASNLMSERARDTYNVFRNIKEELNEMGLPMPAMAKMGYVVDDGKPDNKEHLWFEVKDFADDNISGELLNQPYGISRMKMGDVGIHQIELLSDWMIMTPIGNITPRNLHVARVMRNIPPAILVELQKALAE